MLTFLYYLPFVLLGLSWVTQSLLYFSSRKKEHYLGIDESRLKFFYYVIPNMVVIAGFAASVSDFKAMYVPWTIYGINLFILFCVLFYIGIQREKASIRLINNFTNDIKKTLKKRETEEEKER